jgi:hypothetical protein
VITGGINLGCMKLVGEAFKDASSRSDSKKIVILGIANWTTVRGNQNLLISNVNPCCFFLGLLIEEK